MKNRNQNRFALVVGLMTLAGVSQAASTPIDTSDIVTAIELALAAVATIGIAKLLVAAAPAAYNTLVSFIKR